MTAAANVFASALERVALEGVFSPFATAHNKGLSELRDWRRATPGNVIKQRWGTTWNVNNLGYKREAAYTGALTGSGALWGRGELTASVG